MRGVFSKINVPTGVAILAFIMVDRYFDVSGMALRTVGLTPKRG